MQPPSEALAIGRHVETGVDVAGRTTWFASRVEDYHESGLLILAWPTDAQRHLVQLGTGQSLEVATCSPDAMYIANVVVQDVCSGDVPLVRVRVSGEWQRSQRRAAVRTRVAIRPRLADRIAADARRPLRLGLTNISAAGAQVRSYDELRRGDLLDLGFQLMGLDGEIQLRARVRRVQRTSQRVWDAGCEFAGISERLAQRIVQFIFAEQRAQARARSMQA